MTEKQLKPAAPYVLTLLMPDRRAIHPTIDTRQATDPAPSSSPVQGQPAYSKHDIVEASPTISPGEPAPPATPVLTRPRATQKTWIQEPIEDRSNITATPLSRDRNRDPLEDEASFLTVRVVAGRDMLQFVTLVPGDELVIGRDETGGMILSDSSVSRKHARLTCLNARRLAIHDLGSTNGTCWIDELHQRKPVAEGQVLGVGTWLEIGAVLLHIERLNLNQLGHLERTVSRLDAPDREPGTGLFPVHWLEKKLPLLQQEQVRTDESLCGIVIEMDGIETLQLRLGSMLQDLLLGFYRLVLWKVRATDNCVLLNERTVLVVLEDESLPAAEEIAQRLAHEVASYRWARTLHSYRMKIRTGCALWVPGETTAEWLARALAAMKASRRKVR